MADKKEDYSYASYIIGILSIIFAATFNPIPAVVLGIVGIVLGKRQKTPLSKKGIKLNIIGIIVSIIVLIIVLVVTWLAGGMTSGLNNFPVG